MDNYRPIAVNSVLSKILEYVILNRYDNWLYTTDNQFGFKNKLSTDMCIFTFKQVLEYYRNSSSPEFVCFLDASKAFDRINHWHLLDKLQQVITFLSKVYYVGNTFKLLNENIVSVTVKYNLQIYPFSAMQNIFVNFPPPSKI